MSKSTPENPNPDYKDRDILLKPILIFLLGLTALTVVILFLLAGFFRFMDREADRRDVPESPLAAERVLPPEPRLEVEEKQALEEYMSDMREILDNYEFRDPDAGKVRIPVDQAIDILVDRGLPVRDEPEHAQQEQKQE